MNSRPAIVLRVVVAMMAAGVLLRWLEPPSGQTRTPAVGLSPGAMSLAALGGYRTLAADLAWLRAYSAWEERDAAAMSLWLRAATSLDPGPIAFWLNGARMLAYDLPRWSGGMTGDASGPDERKSGPDVALRWLEAAEQAHPDSSAIWAERATIQWRALGDLDSAAESYRRAAELPDAPHYAARLHAELLRMAGRPSEALRYLRELHPKLSPADPGAMRDVVLARIR